MHRLNFISNADKLRLNDILSEKLKEWMDAWALNQTGAVNISSICFREFSERLMNHYMAEENKIPFFFNDDGFLWDVFIFGEVKSEYYDHPKYTALLDRAKKDFINTIFNQKNTFFKNGVITPKSIDAYLSILIGSSETGFMEFIAPHSYFAHFFTKSANKKSNKLVGDRFSLISGLKIPIVFKMNFNEILFADLIKIKQGAILPSSVRVENNFLLCVDGNEISQVSMGKRQNNKAYLVKGKKNG